MVKNGQKSIWKKIDHCVLKKIMQGVCGENFSSLAWKMAKLAFLMLHSGQNWSKVNLKNIWPFCYEKDQTRALWWKFQLSSMKKAKLAFLMLHSGQKWSKVNLKKIWPLCLKKIRQGVYGENFSSLAWKMAKLAFWCCTVVRNCQKSNWKKFNHCET